MIIIIVIVIGVYMWDIPLLPQINDKNTCEAKGVMPTPPVDRRVKKKGQSNKGKEETEKEKENEKEKKNKRGRELVYATT